MNKAVMQGYVSNFKYMNYTNDWYTGWWAGSGGGCTNWESVMPFWSNATTANVAPCGIPFIPSTLTSNVPQKDLAIIYEADIIQLGKTSTNFTHSLFVDWNSKNGLLSGIYIDSHTTDRYFYKLSDVIIAFNSGSSVYMRCMAPTGGNVTL